MFICERQISLNTYLNAECLAGSVAAFEFEFFSSDVS